MIMCLDSWNYVFNNDFASIIDGRNGDFVRAIGYKNSMEKVEFTAQARYTPKDIPQLKRLIHVASLTKKQLKVIGTLHSCSDIADTDGIQISLIKFKEIEV